MEASTFLLYLLVILLTARLMAEPAGGIRSSEWSFQ